MDKVENIEKIKQLSKTRANSFFEINPAPQNPVVLPVNYWFLPFPNNYVHFNDNFQFDIMETGGLKASMLAEELLCKSSDLILDFVDGNEDDLDTDTSVGIALQLHLLLLLAFKKNICSIADFSNNFFENILKVADCGESPKKFRKTLIGGLESSFDEQKEFLISFSESIISTVLEGNEFGEDWMNEWYKSCVNISDGINTLQKVGQFIPPEQFKYNQTIGVAEKDQEKWLVLEYYLRAINAQLNLFNIYEINLIYCLKECSNTFATNIPSPTILSYS
jgi:hypothetical protein